VNRNGSQDGPTGTDPPNRAHTEPQAPGPTERGPNRAANVWCAECDERLESQRNPYSKKPDTWPGSSFKSQQRTLRPLCVGYPARPP